jgi:pentose-5-phosphate-3-epimerase
MSNPTRLIPSILSSNLQDYTRLAGIYSKFSQVIHLDIMDGKYVPAKSPDLYQVLQQISTVSVAFYVHLMVENVVENLHIAATFPQVKLVYIHVEKLTKEILENNWPFTIALTLNPNTSITKYEEILMRSQVIQIMSVEPGGQGNPFLASSLKTIEVLRKSGCYGEFHIDGSVNSETIQVMMQYQPDILTAGSAVQGNDEPEKAFLNLQHIMNTPT